MSLYNCQNCNLPKISLYSNPSMDLPHNPSFSDRIEYSKTIAKNMDNNNSNIWNQNNIDGSYLPTLSDYQKFALEISRGLQQNGGKKISKKYKKYKTNRSKKNKIKHRKNRIKYSKNKINKNKKKKKIKTAKNTSRKN